jgi:hypothetical protein
MERVDMQEALLSSSTSATRQCYLAKESKFDLQKLAKATGIVVDHRFRITECFEKRVDLHM